MALQLAFEGLYTVMSSAALYSDAEFGEVPLTAWILHHLSFGKLPTLHERG
jgi:hypothetical protein